MAESSNRSFAMASNEDQQCQQLQAMQAASIRNQFAIHRNPNAPMAAPAGQHAASIRNRPSNPRNPNAAMAAPAGQHPIGGHSLRTLEVQSQSRTIQKRRHVSHPYVHAPNQTTFMAQQLPSRAAIVMDMAQFYTLVNKIAYRQVQMHNAGYWPPGFRAPFGFPPANAITQGQQPEKLDLSLKLGPPGSFPATSIPGNFGN